MMPRMDRTFTDKDIIRFFLRNLDRREQTSVMCWFVDALPALFGVKQALPQGLIRQGVEGLVGLLPGGGTGVKILQIIEGLAPTLESRCAVFNRTGLIVRPTLVASGIGG